MMGRNIAKWEYIFEKHQQSGQSVPEFCKTIGIDPNTFYKHRKEIYNDIKNRDSAVVEIKPVLPVPSTPIVLQTKKFMISIPNGCAEAQLTSIIREPLKTMFL